VPFLFLVANSDSRLDSPSANIAQAKKQDKNILSSRSSRSAIPAIPAIPAKAVIATILVVCVCCDVWSNIGNGLNKRAGQSGMRHACALKLDCKILLQALTD
jgi:hypothetical protein